MSSRTVSSTFGVEIADKLAAIAIDLLCDAPERQTRYSSDAKVGWTLVHEGRAILEAAGIDWRKQIERRITAERDAAERALEARRQR